SYAERFWALVPGGEDVHLEVGLPRSTRTIESTRSNAVVRSVARRRRTRPCCHETVIIHGDNRQVLVSDRVAIEFDLTTKRRAVGVKQLAVYTHSRLIRATRPITLPDDDKGAVRSCSHDGPHLVQVCVSVHCVLSA